MVLALRAASRQQVTVVGGGVGVRVACCYTVHAAACLQEVCPQAMRDILTGETVIATANDTYSGRLTEEFMVEKLGHKFFDHVSELVILLVDLSCVCEWIEEDDAAM